MAINLQQRNAIGARKGVKEREKVKLKKGMEQVPCRQREAKALEAFNCLIYIYFSFHSMVFTRGRVVGTEG